MLQGMHLLHGKNHFMKKLLFMLALLPAMQLAAQDVTIGYDSLAGVRAELVKVWPANRTINIVFHGHSCPAGYGANHEVHTLDAYPHQVLEGLKKVYPYAVINVITTAIGGENAVRGVKRMERDVLPLHPDVLFIDYSLNDVGGNMDTVRMAWERMIEMAQANGIKVVLLTPSADQRIDYCQAGNIAEKHAEQVRKLAARYHTGLIDSYVLFRKKACEDKTLVNYMASVNHPNRAGHEMIAKAILPLFLYNK